MASQTNLDTTLRSSRSAAAVAETCAAHGLGVSTFEDLRRTAVAAKANAYCRYSRFRVGAAVLGADGSVTPGVNVENAAYPVGTCAERVAFGAAVTAGVTSFRAVAVATDISPPASPCGMCRQFIREFCDKNTPIIMFDKNEDYITLTLDQLLPMSFGPDQLPPAGAPGTTA